MHRTEAFKSYLCPRPLMPNYQLSDISLLRGEAVSSYLPSTLSDKSVLPSLLLAEENIRISLI